MKWQYQKYIIQTIMHHFPTFPIPISPRSWQRQPRLMPVDAVSPTAWPHPFKFWKQVPLSQAVLEALTVNKYNYVSIRDGKWNQLHLENVVFYITEWHIDNGLFLCNNQNKKMVKYIENIRFYNLRKLDISKNLIESIQGISRICMPCLQKLNLKDNKIMSIAPLRKAWIPNLSGIDLWGNTIKQIRSLSELKAHKLEQISLQYYDDPVFMNDSLVLAKLESQNLRIVSLLSQFRILQPSFYDCLERRRKQKCEKNVVQLFEPEVEDQN